MIDDTICPNTGDPHRYFIYKTYDTFEPIILDTISQELREFGRLYIRKEYATLGCNCGSVIRREVQHD